MKRLKYVVITIFFILGCEGGEVYQVDLPSDKMLNDGIANKSFTSIEDLLFAEGVVEIDVATIKGFNVQARNSFFEINNSPRIDFETTQAFSYQNNNDGLVTQIILIAHNAANVDLDLGYFPEEYLYVSEIVWGSAYVTTIGYVDNDIYVYVQINDSINREVDDKYSFEFNDIWARMYFGQYDEDVRISGYIAN